MRKFSKKLAFVLAAAMVFTAFAPAASAKAADDEMIINKKSQILYVNEGINHKGAEGVATGKGNVSEYDFWVKNKPTNYAKTQKYVWTSSNEEVATVDQKGLTKAVGVGKATIKCTVTDKATGKEVAAPTVKVEVKANADTVVITNGDKYEGKTYDKDAKIDLNRTMFDENGEPAPKRGVVVTDYTRWIAKAPNGDLITGKGSNGVTIDQSKGLFTFGADAADGKYQLYCETYQSSKYTKTTAKSDVVEIVFKKTKTFTIDQVASNGFNVAFTEPMDFGVADVTVHQIIDVYGKGTEEVNVPVANVTVFDDKLGANITTFDDYNNGGLYAVEIKGFDERTVLKAYIGELKNLSVSSASYSHGGMGVTVNENTALKFALYDDQGNDVTRLYNKGYVVFSAENNYTDDYYVTNDSILISKVGASVVVNCEYHTQEFNDSGVEKVITGFGRFTGIPAPEVKLKEVTVKVTNGGNGAEYANNIIPINDEFAPYVHVNIKTDKWNDYNGQNMTNGGYVTNLGTGTNYQMRLRATHPNVFEVDTPGANNLRLFKQGTASVLVDLVKINEDGSEVVTTIASKVLNIREERMATTLTADGYKVIGNVCSTNPFDPFNVETFNVTIKDQYGQTVAMNDITAADYEIKDAVNIPADVMNAIRNKVNITKRTDYGQDKIVVTNGLDDNDFPDGVYEYVITVEVKITSEDYKIYERPVTLRVSLRKPIPNSEYIQIWQTGDGNGTNAGRYDTSWDGYDSAERVKAAQFKVYSMSNGIRTAQLDVAKRVPVADLPADAASEGLLYYSITRNSVYNDVTSSSEADADGYGTVKLDYSDVKTVQMYDGTTVANVSKVVYVDTDQNNRDLGAGNYTFSLYRVVLNKANNTQAYAYHSANTVSVSCDAGKYTYVKALNADAKNPTTGVAFAGTLDEHITNPANQAILRSCFQIKDRGGNDAGNTNYFVDGKMGKNVVHVKSITFFEKVADATTVTVNGVPVNVPAQYAAYTVDVNVSLRIVR